MSQQEERLTESSGSASGDRTMTLSELPARKFSLTMEVPVFLVMMSFSLAGVAVSNVLLYRTCVHSLGHSKDECKIFLALEKPNTTKALEEEVQKYATFVSTVRMVIESLVPAVLSMFLGVWSDTNGRKPLVVWPLLGMTFSAMLTVIYCLMDDLGPWWFLVPCIPMSLCGGFTTFFTGAFCYLSDITSVSSRSIRMTILECSLSLGSILGSVASSYLIRQIGVIYLLLVVCLLHVLAYVFTNVFLEESLNGALKGGLSSVLDLSLVKEMIRECFKVRPNNGRAQILLLTFANSLSIFILYGTLGLQYMYTRNKLHWALKEYTIYSATSTMVSFAGAFVGVTLIQKVLKVGDLPLSIAAFTFATIEYVIITLAVKSWHMYLGAAVSCFKGLSAPLIRSLMTKMLPVHDIAKVFALMCAVEAVCPLLAPAAYNALYTLTISSFPGAIYVLSAAITCCCIAMLGFVQYFQIKSSTPSYEGLVNDVPS